MTNKDRKYGLLKYSSFNIGDEIQSLAAMRFLPHVDEYVHREHTSKFKSDKKTKLIMNAWWMFKPENFPPSDSIDPLLISMHIQDKIKNKFITPKTKEYLIKNGPVGCRDLATVQYLEEHNIPAYFSGCMTTTILPSSNIKKQDYILAVDVSPEVLQEIKTRTDRPVYNVNVDLMPIITALDRFKMAKIFLHLYQSAHCIVASRLHATLPSLALGTPVLLIPPQDISRYGGLKELAFNTTNEEFLSNKNLYDFDNPPENPDKYMEISNGLVQKCKAFTGYDSEKSVIDIYDPLPELASLVQFDYGATRRMLFFVNSKNLFKSWFRKIALRKTKNDVLD